MELVALVSRPACLALPPGYHAFRYACMCTRACACSRARAVLGCCICASVRASIHAYGGKHAQDPIFSPPSLSLCRAQTRIHTLYPNLLVPPPPSLTHTIFNAQDPTYIVRMTGNDAEKVVLSIFLQWDKEPSDISKDRIDAWFVSMRVYIPISPTYLALCTGILALPARSQLEISNLRPLRPRAARHSSPHILPSLSPPVQVRDEGQVR